MSNPNGGPVTSPGKLASSKNALKHGATSKHFVNESEAIAYEQLLSKLKTTYSSSNPLVTMQLERIAKINIQLERINQAVNASFESAKVQNNIDEILMEKLQMSEGQQSQALEMIERNNDFDLINEERINVSKELNQLELDSLPNSQAFLYEAPLYCKYLHEKAKQHQVTISTYISFESSMNNIQNDLDSKLHLRLTKLLNIEGRFNPLQNTTEAILTTPFQDLLSGAKAIASAIFKMKQVD